MFGLEIPNWSFGRAKFHPKDTFFAPFSQEQIPLVKFSEYYESAKRKVSFQPMNRFRRSIVFL